MTVDDVTALVREMVRAEIERTPFERVEVPSGPRGGTRMRRFLRRLVLVGMLAAGLVVVGATAASAQGDAPVATVFTLSAWLVTIVTGQALPILVGIVTKATLSSAWKAVLHGLLSAVAGAFVVATQVDGTAVFSKQSIIAALVIWISGMATYAGFLSKTISPSLNKATGNFGIG